jgi:hypothetical protein
MQLPKSRLFMLGVSLSCISPSVVGQYKEIDALASNIAGQIPTASNKKVAVFDFTDLQGNATELGRFLAEELSIALPRTQGRQVIDRAHLKALIQEHKLASTGIIDPATQKKLEIAGVSVLITGTITPFGDSVRWVVKALNIATAQIEAAATAEIPRTKTIEELLSRGVSATSNGIAGTATSPTSANSDSRPVSSTGEPRRSVTIQGFSFDLTSCRFERGDLVCAFQVTDLGNDATLEIAVRGCGNPAARIIDAGGNVHEAVEVQIGNRTSGQRNCMVDSVFAAGVPISNVFRFRDISPNADTVALIEFALRVNGESARSKKGKAGPPPLVKLQIRDIHIAKH